MDEESELAYFPKLIQDSKIKRVLLKEEHVRKVSFSHPLILPLLHLASLLFSLFLSFSLFFQIYPHLPAHMRLKDLKLLYTLNHHGASYETFYTNVHNKGPTLLLVRDHGDYVSTPHFSSSLYPPHSFISLLLSSSLPLSLFRSLGASHPRTGAKPASFTGTTTCSSFSSRPR
jgi:hypothetical protein